MRTERTNYDVGGAEFDVLLARPDGAESRPAVLIFHPWGGRDAAMEAKAQKLTELGYVGAGLDLYGIGKRGTDTESSRALMSELVQNPSELRRRIQRGFEIVRDSQGVDADRIGAIGFCFGGLCSILSARMGLPLRGVVSFHGLLKLGEKLDAGVKARILVQHGQDDPMVPPADVAAFAEEMKRINAEWQLHSYPGVVHSFTNHAAGDKAGGMNYDAYADKQSWTEMVRFFEETL